LYINCINNKACYFLFQPAPPKGSRKRNEKSHCRTYKTGDTGLTSLTIPLKPTLPPLQNPPQLPPIHGNLQPLNTNFNLSIPNTLPPPPGRLPPLTFRPEIPKPKIPELKPIAPFSPRPARLTPLKHYVQNTLRPENPEPTTSNSAAIQSPNTPSPVERYSPVHFQLIQITPEPEQTSSIKLAAPEIPSTIETCSNIALPLFSISQEQNSSISSLETFSKHHITALFNLPRTKIFNTTY